MPVVLLNRTTFLNNYNFGFGKKTGIDLNGESSGILFSLDLVGPVELATTSFGQGISVTPIEQANALSSILNGGTLYKPYIVLKKDNEIVNPTIKKEHIITKETSVSGNNNQIFFIFFISP